MSGLGPVPGIPGIIWNAYLSAMAYAYDNLNPAEPDAGVPVVEGLLATCQNALNAIGAFSIYNFGQPAFQNLAESQAYSAQLSPTDNDFISSRINAFSSMMNTLSSIYQPQVAISIDKLSYGESIITAPDLLSFWMGFNFETPPTGLSADNFISEAQSAANAWGDFATALTTQGIKYTGTVYDAIILMQNCSLASYESVLNGSGISSVNLTQSWNLLVSLPSLSRFVSIYFSDPTDLLCQQMSVMRLTIQNTIAKLNQLLIALRTQQSTNIQLGTLRNGTTLMDLAARDLGNYEDWQQIAQANNLMPPYIGVGTGLAPEGSLLYLSGEGSSQVINYSINYLGVDLYFGPLNGEMPPWLGDFDTISGYPNYNMALGRRLQTTQGSLMYHPTFGSRIPPEVGKIMSSNTSGNIAAYAQSAIMADPRSYQVINASVQLLANGAIQYQCTVIPNGLNTTSGTLIDQVLLPLA